MIFLGGRGTGYVSLKTTELVYPNGTVTPGPTMPNTVWDHETVALHDGRFMIIGKHFYIQCTWRCRSQQALPCTITQGTTS